MQLELLRESYIGTPEVIQESNLPSSLRERTTRELDIEKQLETLWEDTKLKELFPETETYEKVKKHLKENGFTPGASKKTYKMPIGRYDVINNNNRIYPKRLWENVIENQKENWQGLCGLADHPEGKDPGQWKYSTVVWLDMMLGNDGIVYGIGRFVGPYGSLAEDIIDAGGRVGFSSSGFGEVDQYSKMVNPETYMMERVADVVLNPSQNVFGETANEQADNIEYAQQMTESTQPVSKIIQQKGNNNMTVNATENTHVQEPAQPIQESGISKAEEKAFRKYVESFMNDASEITNPSKKLQEMAEILSMFEAGVAEDLREQFETKLIESKDELEALVESTVAIQDEIGIDIGTLKESAEKIAFEGTMLKESVEDYKILVEGLTQRNRSLNKEVETLKIKNRLLENRKDTISVKKDKIKVGSDLQIAALIQENTDLTNSKKVLNERITALSKNGDLLEKQYSVLERKLQEANKNYKLLESEIKAKDTNTDAAMAEIDNLQETIKRQEDQITRLQSQSRQLMRENTDLRAEFDGYKQKIEEDTKPENFLQKPFHERVKGHINFRENSGAKIEQYWQQQYKVYGDALGPYERQIRGAKTLKEATSAFLRNIRNIDMALQEAESAQDVQGIISSTVRHELMNESGFQPGQVTLEATNSDFLERARKMGLK